jgi:O-methyltransferase domain/Dimerisation domain
MTAHDVGADLSKLLMGFRVSQAIHVAATLGLADLLAPSPRTSSELADATNTHPLALYRLMRALASTGIFRECDHRRFELTRLGALLRSDVAGTYAPMAQLVGRPIYWEAWGDLLHAVRSGETAFNHVHGVDVWEYRASHPQEGEVFDCAMAALTDRFAAVVAEACNFDRFVNVVDIGGGDGTFLAKILTAHPSVYATLLDQPHVIARAAASFESLGLSGRCRAVGGDFFVSVPNGGDVYLMKSILHDWDDTASINILRVCREAMKPTSRLLVVEHVIGPPNTGAEGKFADLHMLALTGGRERTRDEFAALFDQSGIRLASVTPTTTPLFVIEGVPEETACAS